MVPTSVATLGIDTLSKQGSNGFQVGMHLHASFLSIFEVAILTPCELLCSNMLWILRGSLTKQAVLLPLPSAEDDPSILCP